MTDHDRDHTTDRDTLRPLGPDAGADPSAGKSLQPFKDHDARAFAGDALSPDERAALSASADALDEEEDGRRMFDSADGLAPGAAPGDATPGDESADGPARGDASTLRSFMQNVRRRMAALGVGRYVHSPAVFWLVLAAGALITVQAVALHNLISVHDEKQQWAAAAEHRDAIQQQIAACRQERSDAEAALHAARATFAQESARLAEVQAELKLRMDARDDAQRQHTVAVSEAARLKEASDATAAGIKALTAQLDAVRLEFDQLSAQRDKLAREVNESNATLASNQKTVDAAAEHCRTLDARAAAGLADIRKARDAWVKAVADLDETARQLSKTEADAAAATARLEGLRKQELEARAAVDQLSRQHAAIKAAMEKDLALAADARDGAVKGVSELTALQDKIDAAAKKLAQQEGELAALKTLLADKQAEQQKLDTRVAAVRAELKPIEMQQKTLEADIAAKQKQLEVLKQQIDAARAEAAKASEK